MHGDDFIIWDCLHVGQTASSEVFTGTGGPGGPTYLHTGPEGCWQLSSFSCHGLSHRPACVSPQQDSQLPHDRETVGGFFQDLTVGKPSFLSEESIGSPGPLCPMGG